MREVALVCAGDKFDVHLHVKQKYLQLQKYLRSFRLTVFTDNTANIDSLGLPIRSLQLPDWRYSGPRKLWWYKVYMFHPNISWTGPVLYMDLDTAVVGDLHKFYDYKPGKFVICQDFNRQFIQDYPVCNSSVIRFNPGTTQLFQNYDVERTPSQFRGDQDYITAQYKEQEHYWWPREWAMSYKWEVQHGGSKQGGMDVKYPDDYFQPDEPWVIPRDCSIVVWHGKPDTYDTELGKSLII